MGYKVSWPKTFLSKYGGVFTEVLFRGVPRLSTVHAKNVETLERREVVTYRDAVMRRVDSEGNTWVAVTNRKQRMSLVDVLPFGTTPLKLFLPPSGEQLPRWSQVGPGCVELMKNSDPEVVLHLGSAVYPKLGKMFRKMGIVPEAPRALGGAELPWCKTSNRACKPFRKATVALATGSGGIDTSILSRPWAIYAASDWIGLA